MCHSAPLKKCDEVEGEGELNKIDFKPLTTCFDCCSASHHQVRSKSKIILKRRSVLNVFLMKTFYVCSVEEDLGSREYHL